MSVRYDDVLSLLVATVERHAVFADLRKIVVVRDLKGRVRLAIDGDDSESARRGLEEAIQGSVGRWYGGSLLSTSDPAAKSLAQHVLDVAKPWPSTWPQHIDDGFGGTAPLATGKWMHVQRVLAKEDWLRLGPASPPWPLSERTPSVVAFYSFKGGVGRSTALGILAWRLASAGKKVVAVDLDLEAPGLDGLFGIGPGAMGAGVLDWLLERAVGEAPSLHGIGTQPGMVHPVTVLDASIDVIPAGNATTPIYLEKLGRLDYQQSVETDASPVEEGLRALLKAVKADLNPDFIFLDSRAGFHDLGGLSLTALAHIDVVLARHAAATDPGLRLTVAMLERRRQLDERLVAIAQSFTRHVRLGEEEPMERRRFRELVRDLLPSAPPPVCLDENAQIATAFTLNDIPRATLEGASGYGELLERIQDLATPARGDGPP